MTVNGASSIGLSFGVANFDAGTTAANANITANGGTGQGAHGGGVYFLSRATASNATVTANGGTNGGMGGLISFVGDSVGGKVRLTILANARLDLRLQNAPGLSVGSLAGDGSVLLGANNLTVGANDLSTSFSGGIQDGAGYSGGSLSKIGRGTLILSNPNKYTGGTVVSGAGALFVNSKTSSGTGSGSVSVVSGSLGGAGLIAESVSIGTGAGSGASLAPGKNKITPGVLTIGGSLSLAGDATYLWKIDSATAKGAQVSAAGVTIQSAFFSPSEVRAGAITTGTVLTVINNISLAPIAGAFTNLPDGAIIIVGSNTFQANYEGGDGNDLTLTVVP
ncbi:MAG: hypothetical protein H0X40_07490 [Chthoniobacterales bacterium]|nr:hypothetical protein [Chthoniobacterales bacterium]